MKNWTFNQLAIAGFTSSAFAVILLLVNAVTRNQFVAVLLPIAVVALVIGGIMSVRAHLLWFRGRSNDFR